MVLDGTDTCKKRYPAQMCVQLDLEVHTRCELRSDHGAGGELGEVCHEALIQRFWKRCVNWPDWELGVTAAGCGMSVFHSMCEKSRHAGVFTFPGTGLHISERVKDTHG